MSDDHILVYDKVKQLLLRELGPAPEVYKCRFETATQTNDETYVQFASRLRKLLDDYLRSRRVTDFETLCSLLVSNKIKAWLPSGMRMCNLVGGEYRVYTGWSSSVGGQGHH